MIQFKNKRLATASVNRTGRANTTGKTNTTGRANTTGYVVPPSKFQ